MQGAGNKGGYSIVHKPDGSQELYQTSGTFGRGNRVVKKFNPSTGKFEVVQGTGKARAKAGLTRSGNHITFVDTDGRKHTGRFISVPAGEPRTTQMTRLEELQRKAECAGLTEGEIDELERLEAETGRTAASESESSEESSE